MADLTFFGHRWWQGDHQGIKGAIWKEAYLPAVHHSQRPEHSAAPGEEIPEKGTSLVQHGPGAE